MDANRNLKQAAHDRIRRLDQTVEEIAKETGDDPARIREQMHDEYRRLLASGVLTGAMQTRLS